MMFLLEVVQNIWVKMKPIKKTLLSDCLTGNTLHLAAYLTSKTNCQATNDGAFKYLNTEIRLIADEKPCGLRRRHERVSASTQLIIC